MLQVKTRTPRGHVIIAVAALLWSLAGVGAFVSQQGMSAETIAALPPAQRDLWLNQPGWAIAAYALAVFGQLGGSVGLLLRRRWAIPLFGLAIAAILVQFAYPFLMTDAFAAQGPSMLVLPILILLIAIGLLLYARWANRAGLLR